MDKKTNYFLEKKEPIFDIQILFLYSVRPLTKELNNLIEKIG